jgi:hypothetical protein
MTTARTIRSVPGLHSEIRLARVKPSKPANIAYQLDVIGSDVDDIVRSAGGWLFDRAMNGWEVTAFVTAQCDPRPLHILGVRSQPLADRIAAKGRCPEAYGVSAAVLAADPQVREMVFAELGHRQVEITVWGSETPDELVHHIESVQHRLSRAATVFKATAMGVGSTQSGGVDNFERFNSGARWYLPGDSDLTPVVAQ